MGKGVKNTAVALFLLCAVGKIGLAEELSADDERMSALAGTRGHYENKALRRVLSRLGMELDEAPQGKKVDQLIVENLDVFGPDDGPLKFFNVFHVTSRKYTVARETLLQPGDSWDKYLAQESRRRLRDPLFTSFAVVAPVKSSKPGHVNVLVITRDIWSLRLNSVFEFQGSQLTYLFISPAENNLLGYRKHVSFAFETDQGQFSLGPIFQDTNILGSRLQLLSRAGVLYAREGGDFEGSFSDTTLSYPLWQLASKWGADLAVSHRDTIIRDFQGGELRLFDPDPGVEGDELPWIYNWKSVDLSTSVVRRAGDKFKQTFRVGHEFYLKRPTVFGELPQDAELEQAFEDNVFPRSERASSLFAQYGGFNANYAVYRDLDTYDLSEDVQLGFSYSARIGVARQEIGSEFNFTTFSLSGQYTRDLSQDGYFRASIGYASRVQQSDFIDNFFEGSLKLAAPRFFDRVRLLTRLYAGARRDESQNRFFRLGGITGLRGYEIGAFGGRTQILGNVELRSMPWRLAFLRVGGVAFWDFGDAKNQFGDLRFKHDVGLGCRILIPQMQATVFRFDWAFPLHSEGSVFPGRFTAGVAQVF